MRDGLVIRRFQNLQPDSAKEGLKFVVLRIPAAELASDAYTVELTPNDGPKKAELTEFGFQVIKH
jgi:hypothetical protein